MICWFIGPNDQLKPYKPCSQKPSTKFFWNSFFKRWCCFFEWLGKSNSSQEFSEQEDFEEIGNSHDELTFWILVASHDPGFHILISDPIMAIVNLPPPTNGPNLPLRPPPENSPASCITPYEHHCRNSHTSKDASTTLGQNDIPGWFTVCNGHWAAEVMGKALKDLDGKFQVSDPLDLGSLNWKSFLG